MSLPQMPPDIVVFDRGWLSSANVVCLGPQPAVIDTGHVKHATHTTELVRTALAGQALAAIAHTHLHSDHCGGTAALQSAWPQAQTWVPQASFSTVQAWDERSLTFGDTGQRCARFHADHALQPGGTVSLGQRQWQIHVAPGHDALAVLLFEPEARILIAGDALWEHGAGVIFPVLDDSDGFAPYLHTLSGIETLDPEWVIPGHGLPIARSGGALDRALDQARTRIERWQSHPDQHALHAVRVMIKYQFMDVESMTLPAFEGWINASALLRQVHQKYAAHLDWDIWWRQQVDAMVAKGTLQRDATHLRDNAD